MNGKILEISFKGKDNTDLAMLKRAIKSWFKYEKISACYIVGEYTDEEKKDLHNLLDNEFKGEKINIVSITNPYKDKAKRIMHQIVEFGKYINKPFIHAHDDVIPTSQMKDEYYNKEYRIFRRDYRKNTNYKGWFIEKQIKSIKWFCNKYDRETLPLLNHHYFYYYEPELIQFIIDNPIVYEFNPSDVITFWLLCEKGIDLDDMFIPDLIGSTWYANKFIWDNGKAKKGVYKGVNITLPNNVKSKKVLKQYCK